MEEDSVKNSAELGYNHPPRKPLILEEKLIQYHYHLLHYGRPANALTAQYRNCAHQVNFLMAQYAHLVPAQQRHTTPLYQEIKWPPWA